MAFLSKVFSVPVGVTVGLLGAALVVASRALPKCMHGSEHYSFPQVPRGKEGRFALRTCNKCGHIKIYDWHQMRFVTKKEMEHILLNDETEWIRKMAHMENGADVRAGDVFTRIKTGDHNDSSVGTATVV